MPKRDVVHRLEHDAEREVLRLLGLEVRLAAELHVELGLAVVAVVRHRAAIRVAQADRRHAGLLRQEQVLQARRAEALAARGAQQDAAASAASAGSPWASSSCRRLRSGRSARATFASRFLTIGMLASPNTALDVARTLGRQEVAAVAGHVAGLQRRPTRRSRTSPCALRRRRRRQRTGRQLHDLVRGLAGEAGQRRLDRVRVAGEAGRVEPAASTAGIARPERVDVAAVEQRHQLRSAAESRC